MADKRNRATEGDRVMEISCRHGTAWVRVAYAGEWRCPCRRKELGRTVTLGPGGALAA